MPYTSTTYRVLIASPSDLQRERHAVEQAIYDWTALHSAAEYVSLIPVLWETHALPELGDRPQSVMNRQFVDDCDAVIAMFWTRIGTHTGCAESGTVEEIERFVAARKPALVYFSRRDIPKDADFAQVESVRCFRERVQKMGTIGEFTGPEDLQQVLGRDLMRLARKLKASEDFAQHSERSAGPGRASTPGTEGTTQPESATGPEAGSAAYPREVSDLAQFIVGRVRVGGPAPTDAKDAARLYLLASSWFYGLQVAGVLGAHEAHVFYALRESIQVAREERDLLLRSLVADSTGTMAGYYWMRDWQDSQVEAYLAWHASKDGDESVRAGCLQLATMASYRLPASLLTALAGDRSQSVRRALARYAAALDPDDGLPVAGMLLNDQDTGVREEATRVHLALLAEKDPDAAVRDMLLLGVGDMERLPAQTRARLMQASDGVLRPILAAPPRGDLQRLLDPRAVDLRAFAAEALAARGHLTSAEARLLATDPDLSVSAAGLLALIRMHEDIEREYEAFADRRRSLRKRGGWPRRWPHGVSDETVRLARLRSFGPDQLLARLDFYDPDGPDVYRALVLDHPATMEGRAQADLNDSFQSLKDSSALQLIAARGAEAARRAAERGPFFDTWTRTKFAEAALAGLVEHEQTLDPEITLRVIRLQYLSSEATLSAIRLLRMASRPGDAAALLDLATQAQGSVQVEAARAATELSPGVEGAAGRLLLSDQPELLKAGLRVAMATDPGAAKRTAWEGLSSLDRAIRDAAAASLVLTSSGDELVKMLNEYLAAPGYYYSVVSLFDRALYAPGRLGAALAENTRERLG